MPDTSTASPQRSAQRPCLEQGPPNPQRGRPGSGEPRAAQTTNPTPGPCRPVGRGPARGGSQGSPGRFGGGGGTGAGPRRLGADGGLSLQGSASGAPARPPAPPQREALPRRKPFGRRPGACQRAVTATPAGAGGAPEFTAAWREPELIVLRGTHQTQKAPAGHSIHRCAPSGPTATGGLHSNPEPRAPSGCVTQHSSTKVPPAAAPREGGMRRQRNPG